MVGRGRKLGQKIGIFLFLITIPLTNRGGQLLCACCLADIRRRPSPTPVDLQGSQAAGRLNFLRDTFGMHGVLRGGSDLF